MLKEYGWIIIVVLGLAGYLYYIYKKYGIEKVRAKAYELMLAAEKQYDIDDKMVWVADAIYPFIPKSAKKLLDKTLLVLFLQELYDDMKDWVDDGKINNSI